MHWKLTIGLVCIFGVLKKFRPGTPFLTPFLESPEFKNFTNQQVYGQIYTFWTYSSLISMVPIFFSIDLLRFKPILVLEAISLLCTWSLLVYGQTLWHMQLMQVCFGIATSADVAYFSYLYAVVKKKHYKRVTSYIRTASMVGKFLAYSLGQLLVSTEMGDYLLLQQITLGASILPVAISLCLPMAKKQKAEEKALEETTEKRPIGIAAEGKEKPNERNELLEVEKQGYDGQPVKEDRNGIIATREEDTVKSALERREKWRARLKRNFLTIYKNRVVLRWSLWSVLIQCGIHQVMNYIQTLWASRQVEKSQIWNGFVESANTLLAAFGIFLVQYFPVQWERHELALFVGSSASFAALLYAMIHFGNIFVDYALYAMLYALFNVLMAISSNMIATHMNSRLYGLVFGLNNFVTVLAETLLTLLLVDSHGLLSLTIQQQFIAYSLFFTGIGFVSVVIIWCNKN